MTETVFEAFEYSLFYLLFIRNKVIIKNSLGCERTGRTQRLIPKYRRLIYEHRMELKQALYRS